MKKNNTITCSFTMDRDIYNAYKSVITKNGENVKGNLIKYMLSVIDYEIPNAETVAAIEEVQRMKADPSHKTYDSFAEILREVENE